MRVSSAKAVFLFIFSPHRFNELASTFSKSQPQEVEWNFPETPTRLLRRALFYSLLAVVAAVVAGLASAAIMNYYFGPAPKTTYRVLQYLGVALLLWPTLGRGGWPIQTIKGESLPEKVDQWLYRLFYILGSYLLVLSVAWPVFGG